MNNVEEFKKVRDHGVFVSDLVSALADANFFIYKLEIPSDVGKLSNYYESRYKEQLVRIFNKLNAEETIGYINSFGPLFTYFNKLKEKYEALNLESHE